MFKSRKASSQRTRAGAVAYKAHKSSLHFHAKKHNNVRQNRKIKKLKSVLLKTVPPMELSHLCWTRESLKSVCLVFDGGAVDTSPLEKPKMEPGDPEWKSLRISNGDLWVADTLDPEKGITYPASSGDAPFTRIPRKAALEMTGMLHKEESNRYCIALNYGYKSQRGSLHRGKSKRIYSDFKYCNMGAQACRAGRGVREYSYHRDSMPEEQWDFIVEMMQRTEDALASFVTSDVLGQINHARSLLQFKTMAPASAGHLQPNKIFSGIAFGKNVHLSCHTDQDYTVSITSVHLHGHQYGLHDRIVAYFCFPRLGVAVALRPGDVLVFNPSEPHAISSRCHADDNLLCVSMYLKTAIVGLNDNSICLTASQEKLKNEWRHE